MEIYLKNPFSGSFVKITNDDALVRFDACLDAFATSDECYCCENLEGTEAMHAFAEEHGYDRLADIWFS